VRNAQFCLFYDDPIREQGLSWDELVAWWSKGKGFGDADTARKSLYKRLRESLKDSEPERLLFRAYFAAFKGLGSRLPALVPQVYLHFDPLTARELYGEKRLARQRMDFLLFLPHGRRVVIEVDGAQHYSDDQGYPDPSRYAEMVEADRQLRLHGYEVYRFGGAELQRERGPSVVQAFFSELFRKHGIS
jgi:very-short-patch-repair endonuclease